MKTFNELQVGDKIFIWDCQKKIVDIGIITHIVCKEYVIFCYDSTFENNNVIHDIILGLNQCIGTCTCTNSARSLYSWCFVSTCIEPILNFIEENENF